MPPNDRYDDVFSNSDWRARVRRKLLRWFAANQRTLPWRSEPTPYRVWVSEIMLQQTQVATVLPYFTRFIDAMPTVTALADIDEQTLMRHWEGLGYYRRARSMHAAAKLIVQKHNGEFPTAMDDVIALPGIGRYTAGAITSIAMGQRQPILEGNTVRVFSRWIALRSPGMETASQKLLWTVAEAMLPKSRAGDFNQAAMELGALVCTPKTPRCDACPIATDCRAHLLGIEADVPGKVSKVVYEDRSEYAFVIAADDRGNGQTRYLMRPIPDGARWAGLWDFPRSIDHNHATTSAAAADLAAQLGSTITPGTRLTTIKHAVTKYRITLAVHAATMDAATMDTATMDTATMDAANPLPAPWRFVTAREMAELPLSVTGRKIAKLIANDPQQLLPLEDIV